MDTNLPPLTPSKPTAGQAECMTVGEVLKNARERAGMTLSEVASQLCLSVSFVSALEDDAHSKLPAPIYVRGYIRSYAKLFAIQGDHLIEKYNETLSTDQKDVSEHSSSLSSVSPNQKVSIWIRSNLRYLITIVILALIIFLSLSFWNRSNFDGSPGTGMEKVSIESSDGRMIFEDFLSLGNEVSPIVKYSIEQETKAELTPKALSAGKERSEKPQLNSISKILDFLLVYAREECWIEVTDGSGGILHTSLLSAGDSLELTGTAPFKIVVGNVRGISLSFNGKNVNLETLQSQRNPVAVVNLGG